MRLKQKRIAAKVRGLLRPALDERAKMEAKDYLRREAEREGSRDKHAGGWDMNERLSKVLSGVAGEYYVAAELSRRGYIASVTLRNARGVDILATNDGATRSVSIQVKTNQDSTRSWVLSEKAEKLVGKDFFYVFVNLNGPKGPPSFHVVPSKIVAEYVSTTHRNWLAGARRDGSAHKDTSMRKFDDPEIRYLDAWHRLKL